MKSLQIRVLSAVIAACLFLLTHYFFKEDGLKLLITIVPIVGTYEMCKLLGLTSKIRITVLTSINFLMYIFSWMHPAYILEGWMTTVILCIGLGLIAARQDKDLNLVLNKKIREFVVLFYVGLLPTLIHILFNKSLGSLHLLSLLVIVFAGDTFAYFVGVLLGKKHYFPMISPKKTFEGMLGGLIGSGLGAAFTLTVWFKVTSPTLAIFFGICIGFMAQMGDLFESLLKRTCGVKDSGRIMPGHGGVLDRIDGVLFGLPLYIAMGYFLFV